MVSEEARSAKADAAHGGTAVASRSTTLTRLVRRVDDGPGVLWQALLPAAGLAALTWFGTAPFAANDIEASVAHGVRAQLQQAGHGWAQVMVTGQEVLLSGVPPAPGAGDAALAVARSATCPTWAGPQVCAVLVVGAFGSPVGADPTRLGAAPGALPLTAVPSASSAPSTSSAAPAAPVAPAVSAMPTPAPPGAVAQAPVAPSAARAMQACEATFAELLASARLEFASGGAALDARSAPLLDRLAAAARACPGRVHIEGHTDNVGAPEANQRLSEARAAAVRDALVSRGLEADRLETSGRGDTRPLADNRTEAGRAANRRIEFKAAP